MSPLCPWLCPPQDSKCAILLVAADLLVRCGGGLGLGPNIKGCNIKELFSSVDGSSVAESLQASLKSGMPSRLMEQQLRHRLFSKKELDVTLIPFPGCSFMEPLCAVVLGTCPVLHVKDVEGAASDQVDFQALVPNSAAAAEVLHTAGRSPSAVLSSRASQGLESGSRRAPQAPRRLVSEESAASGVSMAMAKTPSNAASQLSEEQLLGARVGSLDLPHAVALPSDAVGKPVREASIRVLPGQASPSSPADDFGAVPKDLDRSLRVSSGPVVGSPLRAQVATLMMSRFSSLANIVAGVSSDSSDRSSNRSSSECLSVVSVSSREGASANAPPRSSRGEDSSDSLRYSSSAENASHTDEHYESAESAPARLDSVISVARSVPTIQFKESGVQVVTSELHTMISVETETDIGWKDQRLYCKNCARPPLPHQILDAEETSRVMATNHRASSKKRHGKLWEGSWTLIAAHRKKLPANMHRLFIQGMYCLDFHGRRWKMEPTQMANEFLLFDRILMPEGENLFHLRGEGTSHFLFTRGNGGCDWSAGSVTPLPKTAMMMRSSSADLPPKAQAHQVAQRSNSVKPSRRAQDGSP